MTTSEYEQMRDDLAGLGGLFPLLSNSLAELAELARKPVPVRARPSDRISTPNGVIKDGEVSAMIGYQPDRVCVTIKNEGPGVIYIGADRSVITWPSQVPGTIPANVFTVGVGDILSINTKAPIAGALAVGAALTSWSAILEFSDVVGDDSLVTP